MRGVPCLLLFFSVVVWASFKPAHAEEILLKNGSTVTGRVSGQDALAVSISTARGMQSIAKADIVRIQYVPFTPTQKAQALEAQRQKDVAIALEWQRIRQFQEAHERKRREEELAARIRAEKEAESRAASERAAALRELVAKGQMEKPSDEPISYWDFAWRSLAIPGWGHFYMDRPVIGTMYAAGTAGFLAAAYETRRRARAAVRENHREAEQNFIFAIYPGVLSPELRIAYGFNANAKAFTVYQHKVDQYNGALAALVTLYCVQFIHIVYNGIAWENGLLIVENRRRESGSIDARFSVAPDYPEMDRKPRLAFVGGLTMYF